MLSTPKHGWSSIDINGKCIGYASYLTPVPFDTLNAFIQFFKYGRAINIAYDAEGYEFGLIGFADDIYIVSNQNEQPVLTLLNQTCATYDVARELAPELISDIRRDIDEWATWEPVTSDEEAIVNKENLLELCNTLEIICNGGPDEG